MENACSQYCEIEQWMAEYEYVDAGNIHSESIFKGIIH